MAGRSNLKALRLVERLSRHRLESIGAELGEIRAQQNALDRQRRALADQAAAEASQSDNDTRPYLPSYLASVDAQAQAWSREADQLNQHAVQLEAELLGVFGELKTRETIRDRAEQEVAQETTRAENAVLDEAGRTLFLRKKSGRSWV